MPTPSFAGASAAAAAVGQAALPVLGDYVARGTAVLGLAGILTILLRRRPAAARHAIWSTAMAIVGVLPFLARVVPSIAVPVPHLQPASPQPVEPGRLTAAPGPIARLARSATTPVTAPPTTPRLGVPVARPLVGDSGFHVAISPLWLAWGWMFGTLLMLSRLVAGTLIVWRRASRADRLTNPAWQALASELARALGIRRRITLLTSRRCRIPVTWGVVHPSILLPEDAIGWPIVRRRAVALHELSHVLRFDAASQLVAQMVLACNWFNPLAWLAVARMRIERERACDDVVLRHGTRPSEYASELLAIARAVGRAAEPAYASLAMARGSELEGRLRAILDARRPRATPSARAYVCSVAAALPVVAFVASVRPRPGAAAVLVARPLEVVAVPPVLVARPSAFVSRQLPTLSPHVTEPVARAGMVPIAAAAVVRATSTFRCPVETEFAHGGVSADDGDIGALELEHDDHRVMVLATDGRCVTVRIDGPVTLTTDGSTIASMGRGGRVTVDDMDGGPARSAAIVAAVSPGSGASQQHADSAATAGPTSVPLYVIDGAMVDNPDVESSGEGPGFRSRDVTFSF